jgi:hypothetical protein
MLDLLLLIGEYVLKGLGAIAALVAGVYIWQFSWKNKN